uniref:HAT C-terminal dimerisation domain-containing protein n=1 Tax=Cajanus cajan TaxID=3821 RepID=A0A151RU81_CAJCA|nr:hypothetical protein KK1_032343 [Cajanus cajan]
MHQSSLLKRRKVGPLEKAFNLENRDNLKALIARMFYSSGLPFNLARNPYYVNSYSFAANHMLNDKWTLNAKSWWVMHGSSTRLLQKLSLKLLVQPTAAPAAIDYYGSSSCCERNWSTYSFIHSLKRNKLNPKRAEDLVYVHTNLRLLSRESEEYMQGSTRMWDIGGDAWGSFDGVENLEVVSLSLDEPKIEPVLFTDDGQVRDEIDTIPIF